MKHYYRNKDSILIKKRAFKLSSPEEYILKGTSSRAKERGIHFDLDINDIVIPEVCPVFKTPLRFSEIGRESTTPSIDRVDNNLGYTKTNIRIISWRANRLKNNLTIKEVRALLDYMEANEVPPNT
jgi:hypothetical protein